MIEIIEKTYNDINWDFTGNPTLKLSGWIKETIDPTPCYSHDLELVKKCAKEAVELTFDIPNTSLFVSHFEGLSRTNGWAQQIVDYDGNYDEEARCYTDKLYTIFFHGKRTPIHPAITRYLVAHEYGHIVEYWLEKNWNLKDRGIIDKYKKVRGLSSPPYYGPGTWHYTPGEVFANDFRVTLAKAEVEYWPHPGIERTPPQLEEWWKRVHADPSAERWAELQELAEVGDA